MKEVMVEVEDIKYALDEIMIRLERIERLLVRLDVEDNVEGTNV